MTFPGLTRADLIEEAQSIIESISDGGTDEVGENEARLADYNRRLLFLAQQTIPNLWGNAAQGVPAYMFTLHGLRKALAPVLNRDGHADTVVRLRKLSTQIRGMEAKLNGLEPRTASIAEMLDRIEHAYNAADQLLTDLESLSEARQQVQELVQQATQDQVRVSDARKKADQIEQGLKKSADEAEGVLQRCETAYSAAVPSRRWLECEGGVISGLFSKR